MLKVDFYAIELNWPEDGHYSYLYSYPENHRGVYSTTDDPEEGKHWQTEEEAREFLETFPYKDDFHVQAIMTSDD